MRGRNGLLKLRAQGGSWHGGLSKSSIASIVMIEMGRWRMVKMGEMKKVVGGGAGRGE
jgi:hypothetical protein